MRSSRPAAAWAVHVLTASGALWGVLAIAAAADGRFRTALLWLALATAIDSIDGLLARRVGVAEALPQIDGSLLDNLVDYVTYVVAPAFLIHRAELLPAGTSTLAMAAICGGSALQFTHRDAKSEDLFFRGFPSYWNVAALYLVLLRPSPPLVLATILLLAICTVLPLRFVYPTRNPRFRFATVTLGTIWGVALLLLLMAPPPIRTTPLLATLAFPAYYIVVSVILRRGSAPSPGAR